MLLASLGAYDVLAPRDLNLVYLEAMPKVRSGLNARVL